MKTLMTLDNNFAEIFSTIVCIFGKASVITPTQPSGEDNPPCEDQQFTILNWLQRHSSMIKRGYDMDETESVEDDIS